MGKLDGKTAIITGAGSGIGRASAVLFAEERARVVVADLNEADGLETVRLIQAAGGEALFVPVDVRSATLVEAMVKRAADSYGRVDILFNNAAIEIRGSATQLTEADWDKTFDTNVKGYWLCAKHAIPEMQKAGGGVILNSASTLSYRVADERAAYCATKGAVLQLTRSLAMDYAKDGIRANCLVIGPIDTPLLERSKQESGKPESVQEWLLNASLLGCLGDPREVAKVAMFLCTPDASFITGSPVPVDGGMLVH
jgi:NAD(P)-dependent dehydrogenase (short-subunit alcohol dehydrogenase family)